MRIDGVEDKTGELMRACAAHIKRGFLGTLRSFQNALLPPKCLACQAFIEPAGLPPKHSHRFQSHSIPGDPPSSGGRFPLGTRDHGAAMMAAVLCRRCHAEYQTVRSPICSVCGLMFQSREGGNHRCADCIETPKYYHRARSAAVATPVLLTLIHQFKYQKKLQLAKPLGFMLLAAFCNYWPAPDLHWVLPVPLHLKRFRRRGFNQSYLLFKDWQKMAVRFGLPLAPMRVDKMALVRSKPTQPQTGLGREQRHRNVKEAFAVLKPEKIGDKNVLLIDDVYTTGATVNECARVLRQSGAARVDVLTLARAM